MIKTLSPKKAARIEKKHQERIQDASNAVLAMRGWKFKNRFKFAMWLMFGRGDWEGV